MILCMYIYIHMSTYRHTHSIFTTITDHFTSKTKLTSRRQVLDLRFALAVLRPCAGDGLEDVWFIGDQ